jgi:hypothetical protein
MTLDQVILLEKHKDLIKDRTQIIFGEGVTNSSKSFIFGIAFILRIMETPAEQTQFFLGGKSLPVLEKMYMQNPDSFYNIFKAICTYTNAGQGGAKIVINMQGVKPDKIIYLAGYDNKKRWSDILGLTIYGFNIEEINIADNDFISELFIRVFRNGGFLYATSNGGDPDIPVYANHLNKCRPSPKWESQVPKETMIELERSEPSPDYVYYFFNFEDNPTMTEDDKRKLIENTPKDSYQWMTKILGIRGIREGVIYADYMTREKNIIHLDMLSDNESDMAFLNKHGLEIMTIGIDVGGTDHTVFTLNAFTRGYRHDVVVDYMKLNNANHDKIWDEFIKWFMPYYERYSQYFKGGFIDNAAKIMRLTMDSRMKLHLGLRCYGAKKYTIKERVDWGITQLDQGKLLFTQKTEDAYIAFTKGFYTTKSKTDIRSFNNHTHKDIVDSVEYGQAPYTAYIMRNINGVTRL